MNYTLSAILSTVKLEKFELFNNSKTKIEAENRGATIKEFFKKSKKVEQS